MSVPAAFVMFMQAGAHFAQCVQETGSEEGMMAAMRASTTAQALGQALMENGMAMLEAAEATKGQLQVIEGYDVDPEDQVANPYIAMMRPWLALLRSSVPKVDTWISANRGVGLFQTTFKPEDMCPVAQFIGNETEAWMAQVEVLRRDTQTATRAVETNR